MQNNNDFSPDPNELWGTDSDNIGNDLPSQENDPDFSDSSFSPEDPYFGSADYEIPVQMPPMEHRGEDTMIFSAVSENKIVEPEIAPSASQVDSIENDHNDEKIIDELLADFSSESATPAPPIVPYDLDLDDHSPVDKPFLETEESDSEFRELLDAPHEEEEIPHRKHKRTKSVPRKRRPLWHRGDGLLGIPHLLVTAVWVAIIITVGSTLGKLLWVAAADVLAFGRESKAVTVSIVDSDNIDTISAKLHEAGLVKYPELFKLYAKITGAEEEIITGTFELNTVLDYHALKNALSPSSSNRTVIEVMIPEGYNCRQIFDLLEENHVCSVSSLETYAAEGQFADFWFLEDVERGDKYCLEGFLFPDTYEFYVNSTPREALGKMLTGFDNRFSIEMREQIDVLNEHFSKLMRDNGCSDEYIAENQLTIREVVTIASLIEEETASSTESATIASVIYNRLAGKETYERYLNIDAAIYYALDGNIDPETGKVKPLTSEDLKLDSPFNTYTHAGLTPTPISNPGLNSLNAALDPESSDYFYYVLNPETRLHQFSKTYEEHQKWVEKFKTSEDS